MKITNKTHRQFVSAIAEAIKDLNSGESPQNPVIYAVTSKEGLGIQYGSKAHLQEGDVIWLHVEPDSFGDYNSSADPEDEAAAIYNNMGADAINDICDNI